VDPSTINIDMHSDYGSGGMYGGDGGMPAFK